MWMKGKLCATVLAIVVLGLVAGSVVAEPPLGEYGPSWYEGIWQVTIKENCYRYTDGKPKPFPAERVYWYLQDSGEGEYCGPLYFDRDLTSLAGGGCITFDFPSTEEETFLVDGRASKLIYKKGKFWGSCEIKLQGALKTRIQRAHEGMSDKKIFRLRKKSRITGWNIAWCQGGSGGEPRVAAKGVADGEEEMFFKCESRWNARWIRELPEDLYVK